jgi:pre-mRNA-splicing factor ATP-dependent RNA helicase DHX38/PRP16
MLGLDRLAIEKRAAATSEKANGSRKKRRLDDGVEPYFKGESAMSLT